MLTDHDRQELRKLTDALWDETLTEDEAERLKQWVSHDSEACRFYLEYSNLHSMLLLRHTEESANDNDLLLVLLAETAESKTKSALEMETPASPVLGFLGNALQAGTGFFSRPVVLTLLLTIGLPGLLLVIMALHVMRQPVQATTPVATITRVHQCVWDEGAVSFSAGTILSAGQQLRLTEGLVELTFVDGATVLLEGPAAFDLKAGSRGFMRDGKLVAKVPKGSEGFAVGTPSATVVDLGTEFGLMVAEDGVIQAHVFQGEVEVVARRAADSVPPITKRLHAGQAVQVSALRPGKEPRIVDMDATEGKFVRHFLEDLPQPTILFAHYGSTDPATEGWCLRDSRPRNAINGVGPVAEGGVPAWSFRNEGSGNLWYYAISEKNGLSQELADEARKKGWVLRARVWVNPQCQRDLDDPEQGLGFFGYGYGEHFFRVRLMLDQHGDQCNFREGVRDPFAGTAGQFVDYEMRYHPKTADADLYVNGRRVKTRIRFSKDKNTGLIPNRRPMLRFGTWKQPSESRYAKFEWGILREAPGEAPPVPGPNHEKR